ncbi:MAG: prephenate dehydrogenase [candidate division KSB1 bacterium]|nr:prephenate dehydrogenase [candidate division KSB1 bacterium]
MTKGRSSAIVSRLCTGEDSGDSNGEGLDVGFTSVTIIGLGVIGGSMGLALGRKRPGLRRVGVDFPPALAVACELGMIDHAIPVDRFQQEWEGTDVVILAVPIASIVSWLSILRHAVTPQMIVTDVGSTKREIVRKAQELLPYPECFVGGHPMAGSERRGGRASDPYLFENVTYVLTPTDITSNRAYETVAELATTLGAQVLTMHPEEHDRLAAVVSHLPQLLAVNLVNFAARHHEKDDRTLRLAAGGFRDMTRIASSPYEVWEDILRTNRDVILGVLEEFCKSLSDLRERLERDDLREAFEKAARSRLSIPRDTKGFLHPLYDILVAVEDKPGVIARISTTLANAGLNIKDIEVLKVREGEGGSIRLALESERDRQQALELLRASGITCRARD